MKPKVVMLFSMSFQPYQGRYLRVYNEAKTLADSGYDVTLLAWDREGDSPEEELRNGIQIKRFHIPAGVGVGPHRNAFNVWKFNRAAFRYLMKHPFDIVHCHNLDAIVMSLVAARLRSGGKRLCSISASRSIMLFGTVNFPGSSRQLTNWRFN